MGVTRPKTPPNIGPECFRGRLQPAHHYPYWRYGYYGKEVSMNKNDA